MSDSAFLSTMSAVTVFGTLVLRMDLDGFLERIDSAESLGPILDPTLFQKGKDNLQAVKDLAESLRPFRETFLRLMADGPGGES